MSLVAIWKNPVAAAEQVPNAIPVMIPNTAVAQTTCEQPRDLMAKAVSLLKVVLEILVQEMWYQQQSQASIAQRLNLVAALMR